MSEKVEAKRDGARLHKNSGRGKYAKADATWGMFTVDYKESDTQFALTRDKWAKVCRDTYETNPASSPCLKVILGKDIKTRLGIIEWELLELLVDAYENQTNSNM